MDKVLEAIGAIIIFGALFTAVVTIFDGGSLEVAIVTAVTLSGPSFVAGLLIAAFGNIIGHLKAIRSATAEQAKFFRERGQVK